ncbi:hypothetical protein [Clostridium botulinum]|uniref:hypothetical protein n=1 Tax=Clostridium botulinum TaxID=1491 RepID=UPI001E658B45|nr:hypothetical protein [Clostridium botulinum]MCD3223813.1 hypothetical protein [Clostridium botulinum C/D]MCD3295287.1 hypothetical protein [Clostridium botulinum C/D]
MNKEVRTYLDKQYSAANFTVVPGHWPDFKSKKQVDKWIKVNNSIMEELEKE